MPKKATTAVLESPSESLDLDPGIYIEIVRADFLDVLTRAKHFIDKKSSRPVMHEIVITIEDTCCSIFASNEISSIAIETTVISSTAPCKFTIPVLAIDILNQLKDSVVTLKVENHEVTIKGTNQQGSTRGLDPEDYPYIPAIESDQFIALPTKDFIAILDRVNPFSSRDESKQVLTGVHLNKEMAATDGHRLSVVTFDEEVREHLTWPMTIPYKFLTTFKQVAQGSETTQIEWAEHSSYVTFKLPDLKTTLTSRVLEGQYPNYPQLVPKKFAYELEFDRQKLLEALEYAKLIAAHKNDVVEFNFSGETLIIKAEAAEVASASTDTGLPCSHIGIEKMGFNVNYLIEPLKVSNSPKVTIKLNVATSPVIFQFLTEQNFLYLVMPIQIRE
ncbi:DNA polymerase III subunit beta [Nodosilinea nodulosa]|uniref:DNA polymerase III subunit beta n=1 Tax=Nodosilinea nodulosa TaxID=416001 RepID=UPI0002EC3BBE|nr:DNA polymerase III subunit beta [Nodosilinea nodulosa]